MFQFCFNNLCDHLVLLRKIWVGFQDDSFFGLETWFVRVLETSKWVAMWRDHYYPRHNSFTPLTSLEELHNIKRLFENHFSSETRE